MPPPLGNGLEVDDIEDDDDTEEDKNELLDVLAGLRK